MKLYTFVTLALFSLFTFVPNQKNNNELKTSQPRNYAMNSFSERVAVIYNSLDANNFKLPKIESFSRALEGYYLLKEKGKITNDYLTIVDFSLSSKSKRMWVIDMNENKIIFNSLVAHGKNSGNDFANNFSNKNESNKSCLGFFATGEVYQGKHGLSLKLDGLEKGVNDNARERSIVMHGADYVSEKFIKIHNRLGKSQGCPALPLELSKKIIQTIKDKSCLFIYHPSKSDLESSKLVS
ncbi:murein L,D-transpeptidase catalytic domain family protein [Flavobacterium sp. SUN052]|uniref:murein L,D-transpeptidase catalytic domain family protein n=1 Tax=Flavobacterium sp. SUN052 TaxID=3002441 RepID=UPI00237E2926|nr:murein L,D-transpeptidase catalytic domain family protein [Flavobacterium sp. SUN052]MEC4003115.1 murein L,D-transpeptidase catalytic domain family protein [Flavobacterium sp. SUN052]